MRKRRGIYLLPNFFTTISLFAGFYSIVSVMNAQFENAAIAIIIATTMDGLDGPIARLTNTQSTFGAQYDSLSDMVSFGVAPSIALYQWVFSAMGKLGWLIAFTYTAAVALRLARFNMQQQANNDDKQLFQGLPSTAAAGFVASGIWFAEVQAYIHTTGGVFFACLLTVIVAALMVSNLRFHKLNLNINKPVPFIKIVLLVLLFMLIAINPPLILFLAGLCYVASGPIWTLIWRRRYRIAKDEQGTVDD